MSERCAPFARLEDSVVDSAIVLAAVPGRLAALGGLRGYRRAIIEAGRAMEHFDRLWQSMGGEHGWRWELEFLDDVCLEILGLDGLERVPLALGYRYQLKERNAG